MRAKLAGLVGLVVACHLSWECRSAEISTNKTVDSVTWELPIFSNAQALKDWASETLTKPEFVRVSDSTTNLMAIVARTGWGRPPTSIVFLYSMAGDETKWRPVLVWNTNNEKVTLVQGKNELVFKAKEGHVMLSIPLSRGATDAK